MEIVYEGWLKKSPPPDKRLWRAKWRRRWFVLRQSGQIPGQYILEYFTDQTCRKLKGHIDLDQCEQVDSGVPLDVVSRKCTYPHVFDIRTPKRLYYLLADSEADMNKWVDCICAVCGLKMHEEELDYESTQPSNSVVMSPSSLVVQHSPAPSNWYESDRRLTGPDDLNSVMSEGSISSPSSPYIPISECHTGTNGFLNPDDTVLLSSSHFESSREEDDDDDEDEDDDPHDNNSTETFPDSVPPPPPKTTSGENRKKKHSGEFYDYPRQIHPRSLDEDFYSVPLAKDEASLEGLCPRLSVEGDEELQAPSNQVQMHQSYMLTSVPPPPPPKVNWETYPRDPDSDFNFENRRLSIGHDTYDHPVPISNENTEKFCRLSLTLTDSGVEQDISPESVPKHESTVKTLSVDGTLLKPPPRPPKPKPPHLIVSIQHSSQTLKPNINFYDNIEECEAMLYDIPPSSQGAYLSKTLPANTFAYLKNCSSDQKAGLMSTKTMNNTSLDEMYDFPRPLHEDQLGATPPAPSMGDALSGSRRHAYSNAPTTTLQSTDENLDNEDDDEYLSMEKQKQLHIREPATAIVACGGGPPRRRASSGGEVYTDMSGESRSPNNIYSNIPSPMQKYDNVFVLEKPPAVDRKLKPQRRASEACISSPTTISITANNWSTNPDSKVEATSTYTVNVPDFHPPIVNRTLKPKKSTETGEGLTVNNVVVTTLSPPPVGSQRQQTHKKRSFRKPKEIPSPNIAACHRRLLAANSHMSNGSASTKTLLHPPPLNRLTPRSDRSSSDDDQSSTCSSSRRNSSNDDHAPSKSGQNFKSPSPLFPYGSGRRHEPEIQYLDLDLELDAAAVNANTSTGATSSSCLASASISASTLNMTSPLAIQSPKSPERFGTNTVYKTVDFVKTKAFNEMRQNVEESYRKSQ